MSLEAPPPVGPPPVGPPPAGPPPGAPSSIPQSQAYYTPDSSMQMQSRPMQSPASTSTGEWMGGSRNDYPVVVLFQRPAHNSRFFAIPLIGLLARFIMLIPSLIVLYLVGILCGSRSFSSG